MMLSIIIPTLNAAAQLPETIARLSSPVPGLTIEVAVSDGGSNDQTVKVAEAAGAKTIIARRGRGVQLIAGACAATGDWFLFLHADTRLGEGWALAAANFMTEQGNRDRAGYFVFALDDPGRAARRLERIVAWRSDLFGLPYGDQGLLISRNLYRRIGGYRDWPLFEDVDLARRIGRSRLTGLAIPAVTSAARYRKSGYLARSARNLCCLALYFLHVPPHWIAKLYG